MLLSHQSQRLVSANGRTLKLGINRSRMRIDSDRRTLLRDDSKRTRNGLGAHGRPMRIGSKRRKLLLAARRRKNWRCAKNVSLRLAAGRRKNGLCAKSMSLRLGAKRSKLRLGAETLNDSKRSESSSAAQRRLRPTASTNPTWLGRSASSPESNTSHRADGNRSRRRSVTRCGSAMAGNASSANQRRHSNLTTSSPFPRAERTPSGTSNSCAGLVIGGRGQRSGRPIRDVRGGHADRTRWRGLNGPARRHLHRFPRRNIVRPVEGGIGASSRLSSIGVG